LYISFLRSLARSGVESCSLVLLSLLTSFSSRSSILVRYISRMCVVLRRSEVHSSRTLSFSRENWNLLKSTHVSSTPSSTSIPAFSKVFNSSPDDIMATSSATELSFARFPPSQMNEPVFAYCWRALPLNALLCACIFMNRRCKHD